MPYATVQQLIDRYSERDLRHMTDPSAQAVDVSRAEAAIGDAGDEIDTYIGKRYRLPLVGTTGQPLPVPSVLLRCACDVAVYRLQALRAADDIADARKRYEDVLKLLNKIASGDVELVGAALRTDVADTSTTKAIGLPEFGQPPSLFGRDKR